MSARDCVHDWSTAVGGQVTAVVKSVIGSRRRDKTVEAAQAWAEADAAKIKVMPRAVANRDCPAPSACMVTGVRPLLAIPASKPAHGCLILSSSPQVNRRR